MIERGALLDQTNDAGATALMFAAAGGYEKICKIVLDAGANIRIEDKSNCSALQYAQLHNRTKVENILQMYACAFFFGSAMTFPFLVSFFAGEFTW